MQDALVSRLETYHIQNIEGNITECLQSTSIIYERECLNKLNIEIISFSVLNIH
jgi:hypothetical protein